MTPTERCQKFCKVYLGHHRTVILTNWTVALDRKGREMVSGIAVGTGQKDFFRVKGMRIVPLAANCEGDLVPLRHACNCNVPMAKAVEAGYAWAGRPVMVTNPKALVSQPVKSFGDLRKAMAQIGGQR